MSPLQNYEAIIIANAVEFTATIFAGPGAYETTRHGLLDEARESARGLTAASSNGRKAIVYAVSKAGRSVLVPEGYVEAKGETMAVDKPTKVRTPGKRAAIEAAASRGELPAPPDFSAPTHARFRKTLATLMELAQKGDVDGLNAIKINPVSTSPRAMDRYRSLCVTAIEARAAV